MIQTQGNGCGPRRYCRHVSPSGLRGKNSGTAKTPPLGATMRSSFCSANRLGRREIWCAWRREKTGAQPQVTGTTGGWVATCRTPDRGSRPGECGAYRSARRRRPSSLRVNHGSNNDYREVKLFMRAEALAHLGRAEDALADLDGVREDFTIWTFRLVSKQQLTNECLRLRAARKS